MKKSAISSLLFLITVLRVMAGQIGVHEAQATAQRFLHQQVNVHRFACNPITDVTLVHTEINSGKTDQPVYYIFNSEAGYIIVSADDRAHEILAWGDAPIDVESLPKNMKFWMSIYKQQIEYLQSHPAMTIDKSKTHLEKSHKSSIKQNVAPLISAKWSQDTPYNKLCPIFPFANNARGLTGCAATSLSMIFHHWKYPAGPIPEISGYAYYTGTGYYIELPSLPSVTFDWENMLDTYPDNGYTTEQAYAVALLMRHVGQQEKMKYMTEGSSASGDDILEAIKFFGYDEGVEMKTKATTDAQGYEEELINDEDWAAMLQNELLEQRPILYLAYQTIQYEEMIFGLSGHAFNVDGYDAETDTYHVNWGWGGKADGYFALNAFNGDSHLYNIGQSMILGIEPPTNVPTIKVPPRVGVNCFVNDQATTTFNVRGKMLTDDVTMTLNDTDGVFELDATRISADDTQVGKIVTVTYSPRDLGTHSATIVLSSAGASDTTITLIGTSRLEVYTPLVLPADSSYITMTQFRADWSDKTAVENVESYSLEVSTNPSAILLASADFSNYPDIIGNLASSADQYIPDGWSYEGSGFWLDGGCIELCPGSSLTTQALDLSRHDKVTVVVTAKNWSYYVKTNLTIASSVANQKCSLRNNYAEYVAVLDCNDIDSISFKAGSYYSGYYIMIQKIEIYAGELEDNRLRNASEEDDANYRLVTSITDKNYTVEGLTPGGTFFYKVKARYVDGSESPWSIAQMVTLFDQNHEYQSGDVNHDGLFNFSDVVALINYVMNNDYDVCPICSDINHDGIMNITDVVILINLVINGN